MKSAVPKSLAKELSMNLRTVIITGAAIVALAAPAAATARILPVKHPSKHALRAAKKQSCICITPVAIPASTLSFEAQYDADLVDHGLAPVFGTTAATD
jgi:hypothetical protein